MAIKVDPSTLSPTGWWKAHTLTVANGGLVTTWADSSGNGRDFSQPGADSLKPRLRKFLLNGLPAVRFDGTDDFLLSDVPGSGDDLAAFLGTNGIGTIVALVRFKVNQQPSAAGYGILGANLTGGSSKLSLRLDHTPEGVEAQVHTTISDYAAEVRSPEDAALRSGGPATTPGTVFPTPIIAVWRNDDSAVGAAVQNVDAAAFDTTAISGSLSDGNAALLVGRSFEHYWWGDVFEVIAFDTVLSEANLRGVALYLSEKYAIAYDSGVEIEAAAASTLRVEMKLPTSELLFPPTLHLKADAITGLDDQDPVASWPDSSGNGNDIAQSTPGARPLWIANGGSGMNGLPVVRFDGTDDWMGTSGPLLSALLAGDGAGSIYAVFVAQVTGGATVYQTVFRDAGADGLDLSAYENGTTTLNARNYDGTIDEQTRNYTVGNPVVGFWMHFADDRIIESPTFLYVGATDPSGGPLSLEWGALGEVASGATPAATLAGALELGRGRGALEGDLAELIVFPRAHSAEERRHVLSYLAARYNWELPTALDGEPLPMWVDVSRDVRTSRGLAFRHGMEGSEVTDRVAGGGELALVMENSIHNSAATQGYYSPEGASRRVGFRVGTPVRVVFEHFGTSYYKFQGWITQLAVRAGQNKGRDVRVIAGDWLDYAARITLSNLAVQVDKRADQIFWVVWVNSPRNPESTFANKATDVYPYGLDFTEDEGVRISAELYRLAISELGYCYLRGDAVAGGQLRLESRGIRQGTPIRWALTDPKIEALDLDEHSLDGVINRVIVELHPREVDAAATTVLFSLSNTPLIANGATEEFVAPYRDGRTSARRGGSSVRVGGINMVTPVATTDYTANSQADGGGTNLTGNFSLSVTFGGNSATIRVTNSGAAGYLTKCQLRGRGVYAFESVLIDVKDTDSIDLYGQQSRRLDMPYQSDIVLAGAIGDELLANNAEPKSKVRVVRFTAQWNSEAMMHALTREIGDRISISETVSGLSVAEYFIQGIRFDVLAGPVYRVSWLLVPVTQESYSV